MNTKEGDILVWETQFRVEIYKVGPWSNTTKEFRLLALNGNLQINSIRNTNGFYAFYLDDAGESIWIETNFFVGNPPEGRLRKTILFSEPEETGKPSEPKLDLLF